MEIPNRGSTKKGHSSQKGRRSSAGALSTDFVPPDDIVRRRSSENVGKFVESAARAGGPAIPPRLLRAETAPVGITSTIEEEELTEQDVNRALVVISAVSCGGILRWIGKLEASTRLLCGVELDLPIGEGDGIYRGKRLFLTGPKRAWIGPIEEVSRQADIGSGFSRDLVGRLPIRARSKAKPPKAASSGSSNSPLFHSSGSAAAANVDYAANRRRFADRRNVSTESESITEEDSSRSSSGQPVLSRRGSIRISDVRASFQTWADFVSPAVYQSVTPIEQKRQHTLLEFISTEEVYVKDMEMLLKEYETGIISARNSAADEFKPIRKLLEAATAFLKDLQKHQQETSYKIESIGPIFLDHFEELQRCYMTYPRVQHEIEVAVNTRKCQEETGSLLRSLSVAATNCGGMDLNSYLLKPLQRMTRYPLLLKEILKYTTHDHDKLIVEKAYQKAVKLVRRCNEAKRYQELQDVYAKISNEAHVGDEVLGGDLHFNDIPKLLGRPSEGVIALLCETLPIATATKKKHSKKNKIEVAVLDSGTVRRETVYDTGHRTLLLLKDTVAGPFLVVLYRCTISSTSKSIKILDTEAKRIVLMSRRIPLSDMKADIYSQMTDKKKIGHDQDFLAGISMEYPCPWKVGSADKRLKDPTEEFVVKCASLDSARRILQTFREHETRHAGRYIPQAILDDILQYSKPQVPHERGSEGEKLQVAAGLVHKLVSDCRAMEYKLRAMNRRNSFSSTEKASSLKRRARTSIGSRTSTVRSNSEGAADPNSSGGSPRFRRPRSIIFDNEVDEPASPGILTSLYSEGKQPNLGADGAESTGSPLSQVENRSTSRLSSFGISSSTRSMGGSSIEGLSEATQSDILQLLKKQDEEFDGYAEFLHLKIAELEDALAAHVDAAEEYRNLTDQKDRAMEQRHDEVVDLVAKLSRILQQQEKLINDLLDNLGIDDEDMLNNVPLHVKLHALNALAIGGQLFLTDKQPDIPEDILDELDLLRSECASLRNQDCTEKSSDTNMPSLMQENNELRQKVTVVENELTEMTLQLADFLEEQIQNSAGKSDGGWVKVEEYEAVVSKLEETEFELEVAHVELETLSEDLVQLHSLESQLFGSEEHPMWSKSGSLIKGKNDSLTALNSSSDT